MYHYKVVFPVNGDPERWSWIKVYDDEDNDGYGDDYTGEPEDDLD